MTCRRLVMDIEYREEEEDTIMRALKVCGTQTGQEHQFKRNGEQGKEEEGEEEEE